MAQIEDGNARPAARVNGRRLTAWSLPVGGRGTEGERREGGSRQEMESGKMEQVRAK